MNTQHITTSPAFYDGLPYETIIKRLTGHSIGVPVADWLEDAGLDRRTVNDLENRILRSHFASTRAAFAAGIAVGLNPEQVLLTRLAAAADRLEGVVSRLEGGAQ